MAQGQRQAQRAVEGQPAAGGHGTGVCRLHQHQRQRHRLARIQAGPNGRPLVHDHGARKLLWRVSGVHQVQTACHAARAAKTVLQTSAQKVEQRRRGGRHRVARARTGGQHRRQWRGGDLRFAQLGVEGALCVKVAGAAASGYVDLGRGDQRAKGSLVEGAPTGQACRGALQRGHAVVSRWVDGGQCGVAGVTQASRCGAVAPLLLGAAIRCCAARSVGSLALR